MHVAELQQLNSVLLSISGDWEGVGPETWNGHIWFDSQSPPFFEQMAKGAKISPWKFYELARHFHSHPISQNSVIWSHLFRSLSSLFSGNCGCWWEWVVYVRLDGSLVTFKIERFWVFFKILFLSNLYTQCGAWSYNPKTKSCMLFRLNQPGAPR